jgi:hypothetical protein
VISGATAYPIPTRTLMDIFRLKTGFLRCVCVIPDLSSMFARPFHKGFHSCDEAVGRIASHKRDDVRLVRHRSTELVVAAPYLTARR